MKKILFSVLAVALLWSCGKDDGPDTPPKDENSVPVIAAQDFSAAETISDTEVIGTVKASDKDGDPLTFTIEANSDDLFEITASGELSLASGKTLDAAAKEQHNITVKVDDGEDTASATITIKVTTVAPTNEVPVMEDQELSVAEDIADTDVIGQVDATDNDKDDTLIFSIVENDNDLFVLSDAGILTLAEGKTLDYETATSHSISVSVTDGENTDEATVTITVENVVESLFDDPTSFITTWEIVEDGDVVSFQPSANYSYNFTIDWGDGTIENLAPEFGLSFSHVYEKGIYTVAIKGELPQISIVLGQNEKLIGLEQWGTNKWKNFTSTFASCTNMVYNATDAPNLSEVDDLVGMFQGTTSFGEADLSNWDTSNIKSMTAMFAGSGFNGDLGNWKIGNVESMYNMFDSSGMSKENMSATLVGWSNYVNDNNGPSNITLGMDNLIICGPEIPAVADILVDDHGWSFSGEYDYLAVCN